MQTLFTIGYEGAKASDFVATLQAVRIAILVDIRAIPISRKPGFSKTALRDSVEKAGLIYIHLKSLGDPKIGREAAKKGNISVFKRIFHEHMRLSESQSALASLARLAASSSICLLCFERDHKCCHRNLVAEALCSLGDFQVKHLGVRSGMASFGESSSHGGISSGLAVG